MRARVADIAVRVLIAAGWTALHGHHTAIAIKSFDTAVGVKDAHVYLTPGDGFNRTLQGEYQSEGRNILEGSCHLVPVSATDADIERIAQAFVVAQEEQISQSYAARLLAAGHRA